MIDVRQFAPDAVRDADGIWSAGSPSPVSYPSELADHYQRLEEVSFWFRHRNRGIVAAVRRSPPPGPIFDIGGGNGIVSSALEEAGATTVVVEPGAAAARNARRRGLTVYRATLSDAGFRPDSLPAAGLFDVLEHIEDDVGFLHSLREALVGDGLVYITVPAYGWLFSADDVVAGHFRRYTLRSLRRALSAAGFEVEYDTYLFAPVPPIAFLLRALPSRLGLRRPAPGSGRELREHAAPAGVAGRVLNAVLERELARVAAGRRVPVGGSCLAVARRR